MVVCGRTLRFPTNDGALHLEGEVAAHGLGPDRLISTDLLPQESHLTAKSVAHLYLDTFVYNGHTTSADALWAGVPMLTLPGAIFQLLSAFHGNIQRPNL